VIDQNNGGDVTNLDKRIDSTLEDVTEYLGRTVTEGADDIDEWTYCLNLITQLQKDVTRKVRSINRQGILMAKLLEKLEGGLTQ
jgi:hypothetical protein